MTPGYYRPNLLDRQLFKVAGDFLSKEVIKTHLSKGGRL
jgi:hypothetical protein